MNYMMTRISNAYYEAGFAKIRVCHFETRHGVDPREALVRRDKYEVDA